ncbi:hypothetical protein QTN25_000608 [Entamoeba marina]
MSDQLDSLQTCQCTQGNTFLSLSKYTPNEKNDTRSTSCPDPPKKSSSQEDIIYKTHSSLGILTTNIANEPPKQIPPKPTRKPPTPHVHNKTLNETIISKKKTIQVQQSTKRSNHLEHKTCQEQEQCKDDKNNLRKRALSKSFVCVDGVPLNKNINDKNGDIQSKDEQKLQENENFKDDKEMNNHTTQTKQLSKENQELKDALIKKI